MLWNLVAILISCMALASSIVIAVQQVRLSHRANQIPAHFDVAARFRSLEFNDHFQYVTTRLKSECQPNGGISGLSDEARAAVYDVGGFLQGIAVLRILGILDERVVALLKFRVVHAWEAMEPFVLRERELRGTSGTAQWRVLEEFAADAAELPENVVNSLIEQHRSARRRRCLRVNPRISTLSRFQSAESPSPSPEVSAATAAEMEVNELPQGPS